MTHTLKIAALCGSLREASLNRAMLNAAADLAPDGMEVTVHRLNDTPAFNEEFEAEGWPAPVKTLRDAIEAADGVIFGTPEYNFSVPGVLKNAIDWLSRPAGKAPLFRKPCAIMGASQGAFGTIRAQMHLREICHYNAMPTLAKPEILIMKAGDKFKDGALTDEMTRGLIKDAMTNLAAMIHTEKGDAQ
ncbi:MAG: NADPH-dependent FMN reductase [Maricaulis sp.]|jgi:chromate reductase|nr:NADPH-dependent FMN reductase [Maricaulis sp.]HAQ36335.1 NADPH-dependent FMN reductase [Alphaproteobacteria bacterium]|tara:strand:- start:175 stop:741 length:567 start_codon:yes stop_codon:yes gene_type:complete